MRFNKSFTRSVACVGFSLLLLLAAFARPALAQSEDASADASKTPVSKMSVAPKALTYSVNLIKTPSQTKQFKITDPGTVALHVTVGCALRSCVHHHLRRRLEHDPRQSKGSEEQPHRGG